MGRSRSYWSKCVRLELTLALRIMKCHFRARPIALGMVAKCRNGWDCQVLEVDLKTSLPRKLHFTSSNMVIELVERAGAVSLTKRAG